MIRCKSAWIAVASVVAGLLAPLATARAEMAPPLGTHWLALASSRDLDTAIGAARLYGDDARVLSTASGWYAVALTPRPGTLPAIAKAWGWPKLPADALLSAGKAYVDVAWAPKVATLASAEVEIGRSAELRAGDFTVRFGSRKTGETGWIATIALSQAGTPLWSGSKALADMSTTAASQLAVVELDRGNAYPEVVFDAFSGGAHCCTTTYALTAAPAGWSLVELGEHDGGGPAFEDVDGDGAAELVTADESFYYSLDCYACSNPPIRIARLDGTAVVDVSRRPAYVHRLRQDVAGMEFQARLDPEHWKSNGFLGGWVAAKTRLGEGDEAWRRMLPLYDGSSDFGLTQCRDDKPVDDCPPKRQYTLGFLDSLAKLIEEHDYGPLPPSVGE